MMRADARCPCASFGVGNGEGTEPDRAGGRHGMRPGSGEPGAADRECKVAWNSAGWVIRLHPVLLGRT